MDRPECVVARNVLTRPSSVPAGEGRGPRGASAALIASLVLAGAVAAQDLDDASCLKCHADRVDPKALQGSVHAKLACAECHSDAQADTHERKKPKRVACGKCHADPAAEFAKSIHTELSRQGVPDVPTCASCHGTHNVYRPTDLRSMVNHLQVDTTCLKCHAGAEIKARHPGMRAPEFVEKYKASVHGRAVHFKGLTVAATCSTCHGHHAIRPAKDPTSSVHRNNIPKTCSECHVGIYKDWEESAHGKAWKAGSAKGPVCTTCHNAHQIEDPEGRGFRLHTKDRCGGCHKEAATTYRDTFHGKATSLGFVVAATCSDCHTAHRNLPKSDPASTVNPDNLVDTCGRCHKGATANFVRYNPHADPKSAAQSKLVYWVQKFMHLLLLSVFSFFGIHTLLWLQRSIVAMVRKEMPHEKEEGPFVRRFPKTTIAVHATIVVSFLTLVATGFPLRYHYMGWAKAVLSVFGGIEVSRYFHRCMAVVTFGYGFFHLANLVYRRVVKRETGLFWGPSSLVPRWKDFVDLLHNLRWFFYLGKPPQYGRWTYFEKFDYFAVFWGIPIIGLSGLVMWFPGFFTRFLPGEILNVAVIVHSEEALLAAGFIFTIHFFHNHLRPENFPLDTSIFTGRLTLGRFQRERPEEYALLVKANRLNDVLIAPPTPGVRMASRLFGFTALGIGTALILAVIATFLFVPK